MKRFEILAIVLSLYFTITFPILSNAGEVVNLKLSQDVAEQNSGIKQISSHLSNYFFHNSKLPMNEQFSGVVLLAKGDEIIFQGAYGNASNRFNYANNLKTKFSLASVGKLFTSIAIAQLVESGKVNLDSPVSNYIDSDWLPSKLAKKITIQQLLIHASGLGDFFSNKEFKYKADSGEFVNVNDYRKIINSEKLTFSPGSSQSYSNSGYILLGAIIERVSGENYFTYIQKNIFDKADMHNSGFYRMDQPTNNLAIGYIYRIEDGVMELYNNLFDNVFIGSPAGGAYSTVGDMLKFSSALRGNLLLNKKLTKVVLSTNVIRLEIPSSQYRKKFNEVSGVKYYGDFTKYGFAGAWNKFGFAVWNDPMIIGHTGGISGVDNYFGIYLDKEYTLIIFSNVSNTAKLNLLRYINTLLGYQFTNYNM